MANPRPRGAMEQRRTTVGRIDAFTVKHTFVVGRAILLGAGEATIDINFPVWFIEKPVLTVAGDLLDGSFAAADFFPTTSGMVTNWTVERDVPGAFEGYYTAARILVVTSGKLDQISSVNYMFEARAMRNPLNQTSDEVDGVI